MDLDVLIPGITAFLALVFSVALLDQWRERRQPYQAIWCLGMAFFAVANNSPLSPSMPVSA